MSDLEDAEKKCQDDSRASAESHTITMRNLNTELQGLQEIGASLEAENARLQKEYDDIERAAFARYMRPF